MAQIIQYKWTPKDQTREAGAPWKESDPPATKPEHYVTPYGILSGRDAKWKKYTGKKEEAPVPIDLAMSNEKALYVDRFFPKGKRCYVWETIPDELLGPATFGELCAALFKANPNKYVAEYYDAASLASKAMYKNRMPYLLLDYWDNTLLRYDVVTGVHGSFSYDMDPKSIPTGGKSVKWKALAVQVVPEKKSVAFGKNDFMVDTTYSTIEETGEWLSDRAAEIHEILEKSARLSKDRVLTLAGLNALYVYFECCARNPTSVSAHTLASDVVALLPDVRAKVASMPLADVAPGTKAQAATLDPRLLAAERAALQLSSDLHKDLAQKRELLRQKLFEDERFKKNCEYFFQFSIDKNQTETVRFKTAMYKLTAGMANALHALAEVPGSESDSDDLFKMRECAPVQRPTRSDQIRGKTAFEVVFSYAGYETWPVPESEKRTILRKGNLAGAISLSVAHAEAYTFWSLGPAVNYIKKNGGKYNSIRTNVIKALNPTPTALVLEQRMIAASKKNDQAELDKVFGDLETHLKASQALGAIDAAKNVMQVVALFSSLEDCAKTLNSPTATTSIKIVKIGSYAASGGATFIGTYENVTKLFCKYDAKLFAALGKAKLAVGAVGALFGAIEGGIRFAEAYDKGSTLGMISAGASVGASIASLCEVALIFAGINPAAAVAIGAVLMIIAISAALCEDLPNDDREKLRAIAQSVIRNMESNDFYRAMIASTPDLKTRMEKLKKGIAAGMLDYAPNQVQIVESLKAAGFTAKTDIPIIVNTTAMPSDQVLGKLVTSTPDLLIHVPE